MNAKLLWLCYYFKNQLRRYWNGIMYRINNTNLKLNAQVKKKLRYLDATAANEVIRKAILESKPIMISRFGSVEARLLGEGFGIECGVKKHFSAKALRSIYSNAGVFPFGETMAMRFFKITKESISCIDLLGFWPTLMQDYLVNEHCRSDVLLTNLGSLDPLLNSTCSWTTALKGKNVLVVHPFQDTIEAQYKKRKLLFDIPDFLPEFNLHVVRAVQTIAGQKDERFEDWEQALQYMYNDCMKYEFDVVILGCGAYGMPLAAMLKSAGKTVIHLGGATQLLFGIKEHCWDNLPVAQFYNEHWTRPLPTETPQNADKVENACYW